MEIVTTYLSEIVALIIGAIGGAAISIPLTIKFQTKRLSVRSNQPNQSHAIADGDIVGRDKTTNTHTDGSDKRSS